MFFVFFVFCGYKDFLYQYQLFSSSFFFKNFLVAKKLMISAYSRWSSDEVQPGHEVLFSRKRSGIDYSLLMVNNVHVKRLPFCKHPGLILDSKLDLNEHINTVLSKFNKVNSSALKVSIYFTAAFPFIDI